VLCDDGSTDGTGRLIDAVPHPRTRTMHRHAPSGPPVAYNAATECATGDWLFCTAANDVVQPGVFAAWAEAVARWPDAELLVGDIAGEPLRWADEPTYLAAAEVADRLRPGGQIAGASVFYRRAVWEREGGYDPTLEWLSDWWLYHRLALTAGCVYLPQPIAWLSQSPRQYSNGFGNPVRMARVAARLTEELRRPEHAAVREAILPLPLLDFPHAGGGRVRTLLEQVSV
jgi:glycosyltransferase involved in cell wall biosynthesis